MCPEAGEMKRTNVDQLTTAAHTLGRCSARLALHGWAPGVSLSWANWTNVRTSQEQPCKAAFPLFITIVDLTVDFSSHIYRHRLMPVHPLWLEFQLHVSPWPTGRDRSAEFPLLSLTSARLCVSPLLSWASAIPLAKYDVLTWSKGNRGTVGHSQPVWGPSLNRGSIRHIRWEIINQCA